MPITTPARVGLGDLEVGVTDFDWSTEVVAVEAIIDYWLGLFGLAPPQFVFVKLCLRRAKELLDICPGVLLPFEGTVVV